MSVDALLVELPVKLVCRRSQVRFLLTGFHARCVDFINGINPLRSRAFEICCSLTCGTKVPRYENNTMTDTMLEGKVKKLQLSELKACLSADGFNVDEPGVLLVIGLEGVKIQWADTGLEDGHQGRVKLPMLAIAFSELVRQVMTNKPKALAVVAEWYGLHFEQQAKMDGLREVLQSLGKDGE